MKLTAVEIENFRCFGRANFDLTRPGGGEPLQAALLVGPNGSGKTAALQAITGVFAHVGPGYGSDSLGIQDVRAGAETCCVRVSWRDTLAPDRVPAQRAVAVELKVSEDGVGMQELPSSSVAFKAWRVCVAAGRPRAAGLAAAFDVYRLLPPVLVTGPNVAAVAQHHFEGSMMPTVSRGGGLQQRFGKLKQWIVNLDTQRAKAKADRGQDLPAWDTLHRGLNTMLKPYVFDGVDDRFEVFFRTPTGRVPLEALSDGLRSVFVIVCEMMFRMSLAADSPERILDQEMLCLIDEIDAHLHPRWQETVLPGLRALFPNSQIVATTHSPIVAATAQPHEVFRLEEEA